MGNSLGFRQTGFNQEGFAPSAKIYMVDVDENESKKPGLCLEKFIHMELNKFFEVANKIEVRVQAHLEWMEYCKKLKEKFTPYESIKNGIIENKRVDSYYFWKISENYETDDCIWALGNNSGVCPKLQIGVNKKGQRVLTNYTCGSMGYDIPAAMGAAIASKKKVYCVTGDGSIMMNLQELQTIVHYNLPVNVVVFSNDGYAAIRQTCKTFFNGKYIGCSSDSGISFPSLEKIAKTFGFKDFCCHSNEEVEKSLCRLFESEERILWEVMQKLDNPVIPKVMSRLDENGNMKSPVLHDMFPFMEEKDIADLML